MYKLKAKSHKLNRGMTYVELIVVLSIFSIMTSITLFDYGKFQAKEDIKVLANDIALKIVEAQKSAVNGKWDSRASSNWKPSYGVYFNLSDNKNFIYFADLDNNTYYQDSGCAGECLKQISITKGNSISEIKIFGTGCPATVNNINIVFKRPDSSAIITSNPAFLLSCNISYVQITASSSSSFDARVKVYSSGRIQIN